MTRARQGTESELSNSLHNIICFLVVQLENGAFSRIQLNGGASGIFSRSLSSAELHFRLRGNVFLLEFIVTHVCSEPEHS